MKRLREMYFDDSSSEGEEEIDDDFEMAIVVIVNEDFWWPTLGSQFDRLYINQDKAEGHEKLMKVLFQTQCNISGEVFYSSVSHASKPLPDHCKSYGEHDEWFTPRMSALGQISVRPLIKCVTVVRVLAYVFSA